MRHRAAHHADVGADGDGRQPTAVEDPEVGLIVVVVLMVEAGLIGVQAVAVLHRKLAHPDQPGPRPRVVAPFRLDVVDEARELAIGANLPAHQIRHHLFMGHRQHQIAARPIAQPRHLGPDLIPAAGFLPECSRVDHRHRHFLAADRVDFLPHQVLDLRQRAARQRQVAEEAGGKLPDEPGADQQFVAGTLRLGGTFTQGLAEQLAHAHVRLVSSAAKRKTPRHAGQWRERVLTRREWLRSSPSSGRLRSVPLLCFAWRIENGRGTGRSSTE